MATVSSSGRSVGFSTATLRFFDYGVGGSVPNITKGIPLGLDGDWKKHGELVLSVDALETLRGGDPPDEDEDEEWDDNWRVPREYFADDGLLDKEKRAEILRGTGRYRRCSLDLLAAQTGWAIAARKAESASTVGQSKVLPVPNP